MKALLAIGAFVFCLLLREHNPNMSEAISRQDEPLRGQFHERFNLERMSGHYNLIEHSETRKDMEIVDYQERELKQLISKANNALREIGEEFDQVEDEHRRRKLEAEAASVAQKFDVELQILLKPQWSNLQASMFRQLLNERGILAVALTPGIKQKIEISDKQQKAILEQAEDIRRRVDEQLRQMQSKALKQLLKNLTSEQQEKICDMAGINSLADVRQDGFLYFYKRLRMLKPNSLHHPSLLKHK